jgi:pyrroline-5-carboxylate reductase
MKRNRKQLTVGILGAGRMGSAIAGRLPDSVRLLICDRDAKRAKDLARGLSAGTAGAEELFTRSDIILIIVPPEAAHELVRRYAGKAKPGALLINMATSVPTDRLRKEAEGNNVKIIGVKIIGQAYGISKGYRAVFIVSPKARVEIGILKRLFRPIGRVVVSDEMLADKINAEATRFGLRLAIGLRDSLNKFCPDKEMVDVAIQTVAVGTIQDYPTDGFNEYIEARLKEL